MAESAVLALFQLPMSLNWSAFGFADQGANLSIQALLDRGLIPTVDFGYTYGLLPLLIGRGWFAVFGRTPQAYALAMLAFDMLIAWGLARCVTALGAARSGLALILCSMLWATLASYISLAHACEALLLCHALAEHSARRRSLALMLLTVCLFVKPVMAYLYGLILVILIIRDCLSTGKGRAEVTALIFRSFTPAAVTLALLSVFVGGWFGLKPLVSSLLPLRGALLYREMHYGFFFGRGSRFWNLHGAPLRAYILQPTGHYLLGTVVLAATTVAALWRFWRRPGAVYLRDEVILCCGVMHVTFLTMFYGDWMSWTYYYDILLIGLLAFSARSGRAAVAVGLIAVLALVGQRYPCNFMKSFWSTTRPGADTANLWADAEEREDWRLIREIKGDQTCSALTSHGGCIETLEPGFAHVENWFLEPAIALPAEIRRKYDQVAGSQFVLIRRGFFDSWPQFRMALVGCEVALSTPRYLLYRRLVAPMHGLTDRL